MWRGRQSSESHLVSVFPFIIDFIYLSISIYLSSLSIYLSVRYA